MLAAAYFKSNEAARDKDSVGLGNEIAVGGESVGTGEQSKFRFVVADLYGKRSAVAFGHIGWVGDDDVEGLARDRCEQIALKKTDSIGDGVLLRVRSRNHQGLRGKVDSRDAREG